MVVDEWHELIGSKRGVQAQLALARLRRFNPALVTWGLSATLGNLEEAMQVLCGPNAAPPPLLVRGKIALRRPRSTWAWTSFPSSVCCRSARPRVFRKYDRANLLLGQAEREVLSQELDLPLMVERFREQLTTEQLSTRLDRTLRDMEGDSGY